MIGLFSILGLLAVLLERRLLLRRSTILSRLPIRKCFLLTLSTNMYLKLTKLQPGLSQALLELILSREQERAKIASIGSELCMHRLVCHGNSHAEWTGIMRWQVHLDSLNASPGRRHSRRVILTEEGLCQLEVPCRRRRNGCARSLRRRLCLLRRHELVV